MIVARAEYANVKNSNTETLNQTVNIMNKRYTLLGIPLIILTFWWPSAAVFAQNGQIAGTVVDQDEEPLAGVNVVIEGTSMGSVTDSEGDYTISGVAPGSYTVVASFIGFASQEIPNVMVSANETTELDIVLVETALELGGLSLLLSVWSGRNDPLRIVHKALALWNWLRHAN